MNNCIVRLKAQGDIKTLSSYDIVGDVAVIRIPRSLTDETRLIAEDLMRKHRNVETVLAQVGRVSGDLRLRRLKWICRRKEV